MMFVNRAGLAALLTVMMVLPVMLPVAGAASDDFNSVWVVDSDNWGTGINSIINFLGERYDANQNAYFFPRAGDQARFEAFHDYAEQSTEIVENRRTADLDSFGTEQILTAVRDLASDYSDISYCEKEIFGGFAGQAQSALVIDVAKTCAIFEWRFDRLAEEISTALASGNIPQSNGVIPWIASILSDLEIFADAGEYIADSALDAALEATPLPAPPVPIPVVSSVVFAIELNADKLAHIEDIIRAALVRSGLENALIKNPIGELEVDQELSRAVGKFDTRLVDYQLISGMVKREIEHAFNSAALVVGFIAIAAIALFAAPVLTAALPVLGVGAIFAGKVVAGTVVSIVTTFFANNKNSKFDDFENDFGLGSVLFHIDQSKLPKSPFKGQIVSITDDGRDGRVTKRETIEIDVKNTGTQKTKFRIHPGATDWKIDLFFSDAFRFKTKTIDPDETHTFKVTVKPGLTNTEDIDIILTADFDTSQYRTMTTLLDVGSLALFQHRGPQFQIDAELRDAPQAGSSNWVLIDMLNVGDRGRCTPVVRLEPRPSFVSRAGYPSLDQEILPDEHWWKDETRTIVVGLNIPDPVRRQSYAMTIDCVEGGDPGGVRFDDDWSARTLFVVEAAQALVETPSTAVPVPLGDPQAPSPLFRTVLQIEEATSGEAVPLLTNQNFEFFVEGRKLQSTMTEADPMTGRYGFSVVPPTVTSPGLYDLEIAATLSGHQIFQHTEPEALQYASAGQTGVDVELVIDRSGSMSGTKLTVAKDATNRFIDLMNDNDAAGVVPFGSSTTKSLRLLADDGAKSELKSFINGLSASGGTPIDQGIDNGRSDLDLNGRAGVPRAMVLLSDGHANSNSAAIAAAQEAADAGIPICTIAFGDNADADLLTEIAELTGCEFFATAEQDDLLAIYSRLVGHVSGKTVIHQEAGKIDPDEQVRHDVIIDGSATRLDFTSRVGGSELDFAVVAPNGTVINESNVATIPWSDFTESGTIKTFAIDGAEEGLWHLDVGGLDVVPNEPYNVSAEARTNVTLQGTAAGAPFTAGLPGLITAAPTGLHESELPNAIHAVLRQGGALPVPFSLNDAGLAGDQVAGDGIFSGMTPALATGTTAVELTMDTTRSNGDTVRRVAGLSFSVGTAVPLSSDLAPADTAVIAPRGSTANGTLTLTGTDVSPFTLLVEPPTNGGDRLDPQALRIDQSFIWLAPEETRTIHWNASIPADADPGTYVGRIVASGPATSVAEISLQVPDDPLIPDPESSISASLQKGKSESFFAKIGNGSYFSPGTEIAVQGAVSPLVSAATIVNESLVPAALLDQNGIQRPFESVSLRHLRFADASGDGQYGVDDTLVLDINQDRWVGPGDRRVANATGADAGVRFGWYDDWAHPRFDFRAGIEGPGICFVDENGNTQRDWNESLYVVSDGAIDCGTSVQDGTLRVTGAAGRPPFSTVARGDADLGIALQHAGPSNVSVYDVNGDGAYSGQDAPYLEVGAIDGIVDVGDFRILPFGTLAAGKPVAPGDADLNLDLLPVSASDPYAGLLVENWRPFYKGFADNNTRPFGIDAHRDGWVSIGDVVLYDDISDSTPSVVGLDEDWATRMTHHVPIAADEVCYMDEDGSGDYDLDEPIYVKSQACGLASVAVDDLRLTSTEWGAAGTRVLESHADFGIQVSAFPDPVQVAWNDTNQNAHIDIGDGLFLRVLAPDQALTNVTDVRLLGSSSGPFGSQIAPGDADMNQNLTVLSDGPAVIGNWTRLDVTGRAAAMLGDGLLIDLDRTRSLSVGDILLSDPEGRTLGVPVPPSAGVRVRLDDLGSALAGGYCYADRDGDGTYGNQDWPFLAMNRIVSCSSQNISSVASGDVRVGWPGPTAGGLIVSPGDPEIGMGLSRFPTSPRIVSVFDATALDGRAYYLDLAPLGEVVGAGDVRLQGLGSIAGTTIVQAGDPDVGRAFVRVGDVMSAAPAGLVGGGSGPVWAMVTVAVPTDASLGYFSGDLVIPGAAGGFARMPMAIEVAPAPPSSGGGGGGGGPTVSRALPDPSAEVFPSRWLTPTEAGVTSLQTSSGTLEPGQAAWIDLSSRTTLQGVGFVSPEGGSFEAAVRGLAALPSGAPAGFDTGEPFDVEITFEDGGAVESGWLRFSVPQEFQSAAEPDHVVALHGSAQGWQVLLPEGQDDAVGEILDFESDGFSPFILAVDTEAPVIDGWSQPDGVISFGPSPEVAVQWSDNGKASVSEATFGGEAIVPSMTDSTSSVLIPQSPLVPGVHEVHVVIEDTSGHQVEAQWSVNYVPTDDIGSPTRDGLELSWDGVEGAVEYRVYVDEELVATTDEARLMLADLPTLGQMIEVEAVDAFGQTSESRGELEIAGDIDVDERSPFWLVLIAVTGVLILLAGGYQFLYRRPRTGHSDPDGGQGGEDPHDGTGEWDSPVAPAPDTLSTDVEDAAHSEELLGLDEPVERAENPEDSRWQDHGDEGPQDGAEQFDSAVEPPPDAPLPDVEDAAHSEELVGLDEPLDRAEIPDDSRWQEYGDEGPQDGAEQFDSAVKPPPDAPPADVEDAPLSEEPVGLDEPLDRAETTYDDLRHEILVESRSTEDIQREMEMLRRKIAQTQARGKP